MPSVHIKSPRLSSEQKKRIGDRVIAALHSAGFSPGSVVVFFEREESDILLDGGLLFEAETGPGPAELPPPPEHPPQKPVPAPVPAPPAPEPVAVDFKNKPRRSKVELSDLKGQLVKILQFEGALSSFQAQEQLGLKTCDWAPATLRRFFSELEEEGVIIKQGQKRGTRYVWKGTSHQSKPTPAARLVKRTEED